MRIKQKPLLPLWTYNLILACYRIERYETAANPKHTFGFKQNWYIRYVTHSFFSRSENQCMWNLLWIILLLPIHRRGPIQSWCHRSFYFTKIQLITERYSVIFIFVIETNVAAVSRQAVSAEVIPNIAAHYTLTWVGDRVTWHDLGFVEDPVMLCV